jgi:hypothetical protein
MCKASMRRSLKSHARTIDAFQEDSRVQIPMSAPADPHTQIQTTTPIDGSNCGARTMRSTHTKYQKRRWLNYDAHTMRHDDASLMTVQIMMHTWRLDRDLTLAPKGSQAPRTQLRERSRWLSASTSERLFGPNPDSICLHATEDLALSPHQYPASIAHMLRWFVALSCRGRCSGPSSNA